MPKHFKFVFIPADLAESLQQWELEVPEGQEVECLIDRLKASTGLLPHCGSPASAPPAAWSAACFAQRGS